ncbi:MAG: pitrilysin family protein [Thermoguttaceae bacterium]|jgi:zinc protease|nr:pitrilysin family protein [Thermoguttaceae bacterium]
MAFSRLDTFAIRILVLLLALGGAVLAAASAPQPAPTETAAIAYESIRQLPKSTTLATLSNGLVVIVAENHLAPVATVRCYVKNTGSAFEGRHLGAGISHVLEHVVAGGTTTRRSEEEIQQIIARFGGATNAFTSSSMTAYYIDCPAKDVNTAIELVADSMQRTAFEPGEFERELKVVRRELADGEADRRRVQSKLLHQTIYPGHPAEHPVIGYLDVLQATTNEEIIEFYRQRYIPNNQVFVVVGDVQTKQVLAQVARQWSGTGRRAETFVPMPEAPEQLGPREAIREMDGATYDLALAWPTVELSHPDLYALDVAAYILAEGDSSRLVRRLQYDEQLVLGIQSASYTPSFVRGWFGIFAAATADRWERAAERIAAEVYRLGDELVGEAELEKAKKQKAAELVFGQQTVQMTADSLGHGYIATGDPLFDAYYVERIQLVTADQVRQVARKYLRPERLNRVIIAPPEGAPKSAQAARDQAAGEIRAAQLPNGLRVLVKRVSHLPMVNIQAYTLGGSLADTPTTAGRSALVAAMLDKGAAGRSAQEIAETFDSVGGSIRFSAGRSTIHGSATVLAADFDRAAAVFADCFTRPTFPDDELQKVKTLALGAIARRSDNPQQEILEFFYDQLPAASPYHIVQGGKRETVEPITAEDLRAYHRQYFVAENALVTVFGDIEPEAALETIARNFGRLPSDPGFKPIGFDRDNAIPATVDRHLRTGKQTGMIVLGYPGPGVRDRQDYAAMVLLDAITSGYSYPGGWLHNELRGAGLVYYVHALQITGPAPGYFVVISQVAPEKTADVVGRIRKNLQRARQGEISDDEFDTARQMVISLHAQENTTIAAQAQQAALDELYGLGYDYDKTFDDRIRAVTKEQVIAAANKYLGNHVLVTSSPAADR